MNIVSGHLAFDNGKVESDYVGPHLIHPSPERIHTPSYCGCNGPAFSPQLKFSSRKQEEEDRKAFVLGRNHIFLRLIIPIEWFLPIFRRCRCWGSELAGYSPQYVGQDLPVPLEGVKLMPKKKPKSYFGFSYWNFSVIWGTELRKRRAKEALELISRNPLRSKEYHGWSVTSAKDPNTVGRHLGPAPYYADSTANDCNMRACRAKMPFNRKNHPGSPGICGGSWSKGRPDSRSWMDEKKGKESWIKNDFRSMMKPALRLA